MGENWMRFLSVMLPTVIGRNTCGYLVGSDNVILLCVHPTNALRTESLSTRSFIRTLRDDLTDLEHVSFLGHLHHQAGVLLDEENGHAAPVDVR